MITHRYSYKLPREPESRRRQDWQQVAKSGGRKEQKTVTAAAWYPATPTIASGTGSSKGECGNCQSCRSLDFQNNTRNN